MHISQFSPWRPASGFAVGDPARVDPTMAGNRNDGTSGARPPADSAEQVGAGAKWDSGSDIPAEIGEFLVNTLQRHVW